MSLEFTIEIICAVRGAKSATLFGAFLNKKEDFRSEVLFFDSVELEVLLHHAEEGDAEDIAGDRFAEADGEGVIEERGREAVADACFLPSDMISLKKNVFHWVNSIKL